MTDGFEEPLEGPAPLPFNNPIGKRPETPNTNPCCEIPGSDKSSLFHRMDHVNQGEMRSDWNEIRNDLRRHFENPNFTNQQPPMRIPTGQFDIILPRDHLAVRAFAAGDAVDLRGCTARRIDPIDHRDENVRVRVSVEQVTAKTPSCYIREGGHRVGRAADYNRWSRENGG